jgi:hypothetical protein
MFKPEKLRLRLCFQQMGCALVELDSARECAIGQITITVHETSHTVFRTLSICYDITVSRLFFDLQLLFLAFNVRVALPERNNRPSLLLILASSAPTNAPKCFWGWLRDMRE